MTEQRMTQAALDAIRARVEAATPGEWEIAYEDAEDGDLWSSGVSTSDEDVIAVDGGHLLVTHDDLTLITHAPADIRALLDELQRERDYSAAILERTGALYHAANAAVAAWQGYWPADVDGTMEALLSAINATEIGEDEAAEEVAALRRERDEARAALEAERKRADEWQAAATGAAVVEALNAREGE